MKKRDFLIKALTRDEIIKDGQLDAPWMISLLCITKPKEEPAFPYGFVVKDNKGYAYLPRNGNDDLILEEIEDYIPGRPLFKYNEPLVIMPGEVINNPATEPIDSTVGLLIANIILICYPLGKKIPYKNDYFGAGDIENHIAKHLTDDPEDGVFSDNPDIIYVTEYRKFTDGAGWATNLAQVCVPGVTEKALLPPPDIDKKRNELLEANKDKLDDPATIVKIMDELISYDYENLKGDRAMGFLTNPKKDFNIVRSRLFLTYGYGMNFKDNGEIDYIAPPLTEGMDLTKLTEYINISRAGTFSRAAETMLGGVAVKELLRASNNLKMEGDDCGTQLGLDTLITMSNKNYFTGFHALIDGKTVMLTQDILSQKVGHIISIRNPAYCKTHGTGYCRMCCGPNLARHPTGLSAAIAALGSAFMYLMMKAMHGKVAAVKKLEYKLVIS